MPQRRWKELPHQNRNVNTKLPSKKTWFVPGDGGCKFRARSCIGMYMWQWACRSLCVGTVSACMLDTLSRFVKGLMWEAKAIACFTRCVGKLSLSWVSKGHIFLSRGIVVWDHTGLCSVFTPGTWNHIDRVWGILPLSDHIQNKYVARVFSFQS